MYTNSSAEYWAFQGALIHTDLESGGGAGVPEHVRIYHFAGCQHGGGFPLPLTDKAGDAKALYQYNSLDYFPLLRAALVNLTAWVSEGGTPPPSQHPRTTVRACLVMQPSGA